MMNRELEDQKSQTVAHQDNVTEGDKRGFCPGQAPLASNVLSRSKCHPVATSSKVQSTDIQLNSSQKEGLSYKSAEPSGTT